MFFFTQVGVRDRQFAAHIEHFFMTGRDALSFITLNKHDYELFLREVCLRFVCEWVCLLSRMFPLQVRDKMHLRVNAVISPQVPLSSFGCPLNSAQLE